MIKTLLKWDIISLKDDSHNWIFTVIGVVKLKENTENTIYIIDEKNNIHTINSNTKFTIVGHINQDTDFLDKNWVALRETDSFTDKDNWDKESKWTLWVCIPWDDNNDEMYYNKSEFSRDCEILTNERDESLFEVQSIVSNLKNLLDKYFKITGKKFDL